MSAIELGSNGGGGVFFVAKFEEQETGKNAWFVMVDMHSVPVPNVLLNFLCSYTYLLQFGDIGTYICHKVWYILVPTGFCFLLYST